ncbi:MAG TPA: efflux RND transporter periplasmic adaptor subunit, partial [Stellaceae bacterium]|nr:efflux RND transporter periplasmic adaptor subunit [Stellaceae bacterium]
MSDDHASQCGARLKISRRAAQLAGGVLLLAMGLCGDRLIGGADAQNPAPLPPPVTVSAPLQRDIVEWDEFTGQFAAVDYIELRARVSGYLTEIHFQDGDLVKKGDLLFVIDPRPFEIARDSALAQVAVAQAKVDLATAQLQRTTELRRNDYAPASTFDERRADLRNANAALDSARAAVRSAELDLEFTHIT